MMASFGWCPSIDPIRANSAVDVGIECLLPKKILLVPCSAFPLNLFTPCSITLQLMVGTLSNGTRVGYPSVTANPHDVILSFNLLCSWCQEVHIYWTKDLSLLFFSFLGIFETTRFWRRWLANIQQVTSVLSAVDYSVEHFGVHIEAHLIDVILMSHQTYIGLEGLEGI